jgi:hypothetical protein
VSNNTCIDGRESVRFEGVHCELTLSFPARNVCVATIVGHDVGEFGEAPLLVLNDYLRNAGMMTLFVDGRKVPGASIEVSSAWALWMQKNRERLQQIHFLCGSRFIQMTAIFVRRFAGLEDRMFIYTDAPMFEAAIDQTATRSRAANL